MPDLEPPVKKQRTDEHQGGIALLSNPLAPSFTVFLQEPALYTPQDYADGFYIDDDTPLIVAIRTTNVVAVEKLLKSGVDPNALSKRGVTPISVASQTGSLAVTQLLLDRGANVDAMNSSGATALIQAAHYGRLEIVLLLIRRGCTVDFVNPKGTTALMRASQEGHVDVATVLILANCNVNRKNGEGLSALMLASLKGHVEIVIELLRAGAHVDDQTTQGSTALMLACKRGRDDVVEALVANGAEICMNDSRNCTAMVMAASRKHSSCLKFLSTEMQMTLMSAQILQERLRLLQTLRESCLQHKLRLSRDMMIVAHMVEAVSGKATGGSNSPRVCVGNEHGVVCIEDLVQVAISAAETYGRRSGTVLSGAMLPSVSTGAVASPIARMIESGQVSEVCRNALLFLGKIGARWEQSPDMNPQRKYFGDWQWSMILMKALHLPPAPYELVMAYLPVPRLWKQSLVRLSKRISLAPQVAARDISFILDEMFTDMGLLRGPKQQYHLATIASTAQIRTSLTRDFGLHPSLVESLVRWADVQSLSLNPPLEADAAFVSDLAKRYLGLAAGMYRLMTTASNASQLFTLPMTGKDIAATPVPNGLSVVATQILSMSTFGAAAGTATAGTAAAAMPPPAPPSQTPLLGARVMESSGVGGVGIGLNMQGDSSRKSIVSQRHVTFQELRPLLPAPTRNPQLNYFAASSAEVPATVMVHAMADDYAQSVHVGSSDEGASSKGNRCQTNGTKKAK